MKPGTLYGVGVGPGDPDLITVRGASIVAGCRHLFVPKPEHEGGSLALSIARRYVRDDACIRELVFPMVADVGELDRSWDESARRVSEVVGAGDDACFLTLGDPLFYSTYIYLLRALRRRNPEVPAVTVPGVMAFAAAAALAGFPLGEGKIGLGIVPAADDLDAVERALAAGGCVILMKIGRRLRGVLQLLERRGLLDRAVLVARVGLEGQRLETDLRRLLESGDAEPGYLSVILVQPSAEVAR